MIKLSLEQQMLCKHQFTGLIKHTAVGPTSTEHNGGVTDLFCEKCGKFATQAELMALPVRNKSLCSKL